MGNIEEEREKSDEKITALPPFPPLVGFCTTFIVTFLDNEAYSKTYTF
jgi:hypothetical protein